MGSVPYTVNMNLSVVQKSRLPMFVIDMCVKLRAIKTVCFLPSYLEDKYELDVNMT